MCADAVVAVDNTDDSYRPVNRFVSLVRKTGQYQVVGHSAALIEPSKTEFGQSTSEGIQTALIDSQSVVKYSHSTDQDHFPRLSSATLSVSVHNELPPYRVDLLNDRIIISSYDADSGATQVFVEADIPVTRTWAKSECSFDRDDARSLTPARIVE